MARKGTNLAQKGKYCSTLTGRLQAWARASSNYYTLVKPMINTSVQASAVFAKSFPLWKLNWNGMLHNSLGGAVILFSLQHFIDPALDLMLCLPSKQRREALNPRRVAFYFDDVSI